MTRLHLLDCWGIRGLDCFGSFQLPLLTDDSAATYAPLVYLMIFLNTDLGRRGIAAVRCEGTEQLC